ncbi:MULTISPECIES: hypothetical protein [Trichocoleus]|uniref:Uncharacterized protein n=1 Tax=Trichocoleus desertorum GB2-A4 TaxID=2933944 RepID=A0ABV0JCN5_9CYAN|nr:hypothetical protein [Trichocoleus sp. FACHB-46]MBD1864199.1 hypothetical protein [Trichocoleus sp. FACHB-46]
MLASARPAKESVAVLISRQATAIRQALVQKGYRFRKFPSQAAWRIFLGSSDDDFLLLKYLGSENRWVLYRGNTDRRKQKELWQIIRGAIAY